MHPINRKATGLPQDIREMAARQAPEWDGVVAHLQTLEPGDPQAEAVLRSASDLLSSITVNFGAIHAWTLAQHHVIFRTANRVFGTGQLLFSKPEWTEQF